MEYSPNNIGDSVLLQKELNPMKNPIVTPKDAAMTNDISRANNVLPVSPNQINLFSFKSSILVHGEAIAGSPTMK